MVFRSLLLRYVRGILLGLDQLSLGLELLEKGEGLGTPRAALVEIKYARFLAAQNRPEDARKYFESGLAHPGEALPSDNWKYREQVELYEDMFE